MVPETRASLIARLPDHADQAAWQEFAELYEPLIYGIDRRHGLQPADANDLVQDVFSAVSQSIQRFEPNPSRGRFRTWLFRVARNQALSHLKRLSTDIRGAGGTHIGEVLAAQAATDSTEQQFDAALRRRVFRWAARRVRDSVKPHTWEAFAKTAIDGHSSQDVAREMNLDVGAIYLARSRVMSKMKKLVQQVSHDSVPVMDESQEVQP